MTEERRGKEFDVNGDGDNVDVDEGDTTPKIGMEFNSLEELCEFYSVHAKEVGFPFRKSSSRKNVHGDLRSYSIVCAREGHNDTTSNKPLRPQATIRCGYLARVVARLYLGKWVISTLELEHNHELNPDQSRFFRCNRHISSRIKNQIDLLDKSGVKLHKSYTSLVNEAGGHENMTCTQKYYRNLIDKLRRLRLGEGDASAIMKYFSKMVSENSGFYFEMDLDDKGRLKNVFWADGRSREAYKEFGEVISFDTTYLVNKYDMPFSLFVGVNHHGQTTLFGCGLVAHEDTESFVWLFSKWLECMSGNAPPAIITDQEKAMKKAIEIVFPNRRHRWCLWHVMKKLPDKFKSYKKYENITYTLKKVVYDTQYPAVFETKWMEMLQKYDLVDNEWLEGLYEERARWVPCYVKDTFWAGMSTTQRSESINAFFDEYIHSKTSLKQFVEQYEVSLRDKVEKEVKADADSFSKMIPTCTRFPMEKQIQGFYTLAKYKEFQAELNGTFYCRKPSNMENVIIEDQWYVDQWNNEKKKETNFDVTFDSSACAVFCSCCMFEFKGILCRHAIFVLKDHGVDLLPDRYIVKRWRKDVRRAHTSMKVNVSCWRNTIEHERYNELNILFSEVADRAVKRDDKFSVLKQTLVDNLEMLKPDEGSSQSEPKNLSTNSVCEQINDDGYDVGGVFMGEGNDGGYDVGDEGMENNVLDPVHTQRKGRPRSTRLQAPRRRRNANRNGEGNDGNGGDNGNGGDDGNGGDVGVVTTTKRRGRPLGSKNKKKDDNGGVQDSQGQVSTIGSIVSPSQPWYANAQYWDPNSHSMSFMVPNL